MLPLPYRSKPYKCARMKTVGSCHMSLLQIPWRMRSQIAVLTEEFSGLARRIGSRSSSHSLSQAIQFVVLVAEPPCGLNRLLQSVAAGAQQIPVGVAEGDAFARNEAVTAEARAGFVVFRGAIVVDQPGGPAGSDARSERSAAAARGCRPTSRPPAARCRSSAGSSRVTAGGSPPTTRSPPSKTAAIAHPAAAVGSTAEDRRRPKAHVQIEPCRGAMAWIVGLITMAPAAMRVSPYFGLRSAFQRLMRGSSATARARNTANTAVPA